MSTFLKLGKINSGGFGVVYRARKRSEDIVRALKELSGSASESDRKRFAREVRIQARLRHLNIVPILAHDLDVHPPYFVMPLATGTVRDELPNIAGDIDAVAWVMNGLCDGLQHAHEHEVIHRDLKPENLLIFERTSGRRVVSVNGSPPAGWHHKWHSLRAYDIYDGEHGSIEAR